MKIKIDENISHELQPLLEALGHDVHTVKSEGLCGSRDEKIWEVTQSEGRFFITQDLDFTDIDKYLYKPYSGLMLVRLINPSRKDILTKVYNAFASENVDQWVSSLVILTDLKIRVRKSFPLSKKGSVPKS